MTPPHIPSGSVSKSTEAAAAGEVAGVEEVDVVDDGRVDPRVWPIACSTFVTGSAIGVALPVMPLFAAELGLSVAEYGLIGSVFGGTRLLSNLPLAILTERFGRRPFLTLGPALTGVSMVATGLSTSLPMLLGARVMTGIGGSAQMTGAGLYLADVSRPSNRGEERENEYFILNHPSIRAALTPSS